MSLASLILVTTLLASCHTHQTGGTSLDGGPVWLRESRPLDSYGSPSLFELGIREARYAAPDPHKPTVTVTPRVGLAPLAIRVTMRLAQPKPDDRELELSVWDSETEMDSPICRTTRDVQWDTNQTPATAGPQTLRATWSIPSGSWLVVGCVKPRGACAGVPLVVS